MAGARTAAPGRERGDAARAPSGRELLEREAEAARALRLRLPDQAEPGLPLLLDEAVLRARLGEWGEAWVLTRLLDERMAGAGVPPLPPAEAIEHALLAGLAAEAEGAPADAAGRWEQALALPLDAGQRRFVALHRQRLLIAAGRFADARDLLDAAVGPDARDPGFDDPLGRYLRYRGALARFRLGDEAGLLAAARGLLGARPAVEVQADPVAAATLELVQLSLCAHAFEPALVEIVESLGPVIELPRRLDALATIAFDHGKGALAARLWGWLLEHHRPAALRPYYLGRVAAAAASEGDDAGFTRAFATLVDEALPRPARAPRPGAGKASGAAPGSDPARRARARRSIEWDRNLLLATRDAVGVLAARGSGDAMKALVANLQRYLRAVAERPPYAELTRLYRLASTSLQGPRGYAERVGGERAPVWLGHVSLDRPERVVPEPELAPPPLLGPETLVCLPDGQGGCPRWLGPEAAEAADAR